ncbi:MAG: sensor histidine kinase, partial [Desulfobacca sp.]|uniref:sensor histidine kinase n=1 Tax=Desulfobacca sp. TaxID=2067990 RepID=UPI0040492831
NALLQDTLTFMEPILAEKGIGLSLALAADLPPVAFDPDHIRQVFLNILKNAIEAMERGGSLTVATQIHDHTVRAIITDTGSGIPTEVMGKIFRPFFSTKPRGSGLGLAICQQIMAAHGGEIQLVSQPGQGTTVTLIFHRSVASEPGLPGAVGQEAAKIV